MSKRPRQKLIVELLQHAPAASQDDLRKLLAREGFRVTQATLSRDIHELGLVKSNEGYTLPGAAGAAEAGSPKASRIVPEFVTAVHEAQNLVVVKTTLGSAQPVAAALDAEAWPEMLGSVAGDDTVLIITKSSRAAHALALRFRELLA